MAACIISKYSKWFCFAPSFNNTLVCWFVWTKPTLLIVRFYTKNLEQKKNRSFNWESTESSSVASLSSSLNIGPTQAERTFLLMSATLVPARKTGKQPGLDTYFHWRSFKLTGRLPIRNQNRLEISKVVWVKVWAVQVKAWLCACASALKVVNFPLLSSYQSLR